MRIKRCSNGHFYDADRFDQCPNCSDISTIVTIPDTFLELGDLSPLDSGSISEVLKISGTQEYALKIVRCKHDEAKYQNALYELHIMKRLKGEARTVQLQDFEISKEEKTVFFLEDYHTPLSSYLANNSLTAADAVQIVIGICDALNACKSRGVLHLDIQPKNIFVDNPAQVLLGDFGSSLFLEDVAANHAMRGTMAYMAPEVYRDGKCSEQSDIYSVGLIFFALFNHRVLPFMDTDPEQLAIYKRLAGANFPAISLINFELEIEINRIIGKACAYDLKCRYDGLADFKNDLCRLYELVDSEPEMNFMIVAKAEDLHKRILPVIYVLQTSGSMSGQPISELNNIVHDSLDILREEALHSDIDIRVSTLVFGNQVKWQVLNAHPDKYNPEFSASGLSHLGEALLELNKKLSRNDILLVKGCYKPIVIYVIDGLFVDDYESTVSELKRNQWYKQSTKVCFLTGNEYDIENLTMLTGSADSILRGNDIDSFSRLIRLVSVSASNIGNAFAADSIAKSVMAFGSNSVPGVPLFDADSQATSVALLGIDSFAQTASPAAPSLPNDTSGLKGWTDWDNNDWGDYLWDSGAGSKKDPYSPPIQYDIPSVSPQVPHSIAMPGLMKPCRVCGNPIGNDAFFCPYCGCKVEIEKPTVDIRQVEFSAIAPKTLIKGEYTMINIIMYEEAYRYVVDAKIQEVDAPAQEERKGIIKVHDEAQIRVVLTSPDIEIEDNEEIGIWQGGHLDFSFAVFLPEDYSKRQIYLIAVVYINDLKATRLKFTVKCTSLLEQKIKMTREDVLSAFVSYASQDRKRVAAIIQGMSKARSDLDVFFDVESLRSGDDWKRALYREIDKRDILYLCWSHFARDSKWVDAEWRYALEQKGVECIDIIPIDSPDDCPPPTELNHKHFNDKLLFIINASNREQQKQTEVQSQTIETDMQDEWW